MEAQGKTLEAHEKTLEEEGPPFGGCPSPSKPPSSPRTSLHGNRRIGVWRFPALLVRRLPYREVFGMIGRCERFAECGFALVWWMGCVWRVSFISADLSPLISRLRDSFPPRGSLPYAVRTWQIWLCIVDCLCDPPSSVACGATFPLKGEGFLTLCEHGGRGKHGRYGKYHFVLWFAFAIRPRCLVM